METKRFSNTTAENMDATVNIASTFEKIPWTALQQNSKGMNVINAINQLLSMYHPDDGIIAYERVLKTLLILLENLDSNLQQQIISVVPLPKGVSNDIIKNLIYKATKPIKPPNRTSPYKKVAVKFDDKFDTEVLNENANIHLNQNIWINGPQNFELNPVPEVFKGFPPNEILTIDSHNKNEILNLEIIHCDRFTQKEEIFEQKSKKHYNLNKNKIYNMGKQELNDEQLAIQQDIYKMDVMHYEEEEKYTIMNAQILKGSNLVMDNFMIHKKLKTSVQNFLRRIEQEILIDFPIFPQTRPLHAGFSIPKCTKFLNQKNLKNTDKFNVSNNYTNNAEDISALKSTKKFIRKISSASHHIYPKPYRLQMLPKCSNTALGNSQTIELKNKDNIKNLLYKSTVKQMKEKDFNTLQQTASITELAIFKKQYYDTLLNIQKAKMAVANSLAISSVENLTNAYYGTIRIIK
ncbi:unnamed protein product [Xylocopa violacea]|uniref:Uncharacterized protein n=1 Tax=Xylocopa violacea TaxID=135666 RepID=A0ABP1N3S9_XYLVO